jgi:hypothetical protein
VPRADHEDMSAIELLQDLHELQAERATLGLFTADDEAEMIMSEMGVLIEETRIAYVAAAVSEIAMMRAELDGPQVG